jgi:hypothetical protein
MIPGVTINGQSADMTNRPKLDLGLSWFIERSAASGGERRS